jgi:hypothetical protein
MRTLKRHDTAEPITGKATSDSEPDGVNLTVFETVNLHFKTAPSGPVQGGVVAQANVDGTYVYEQIDTDVSVAGLYEVELECILANGKKVHFPNVKAENPKLTIDEDLDDS